MNRRRLLAIGILATLTGGLTRWSVSRSLSAKFAPGENVVVAARNIELGERIKDGDLQVAN